MPFTSFPTQLGECGVAWNDACVTGFALPDECAGQATQRMSMRWRAAAAVELPDWIESIIVRAKLHLDGVPQDFSTTALDWSRVSEFQQAVFRETQAIKPGCTKSYGEIARLLALGPEAARAVGVALATNPWPLIVPCHRVVAANGKLTGFSAPGGIRTKARLLALEGAELRLE